MAGITLEDEAWTCNMASSSDAAAAAAALELYFTKHNIKLVILCYIIMHLTKMCNPCGHM